MKTKDLGDLIHELSKIDTMCKGDYTVLVKRGGVDLFVDGLDSWRGNYSKLALGYTSRHNHSFHVRDLLDELVDAVGKEFIGYKGGNYRMTTRTEVWCDNYGCCTYYTIKDIVVDDELGTVTLLCTYEEY